MSEKLMAICPRHKKAIPLIWTFAFPGKEFWCPYCGYSCGMFGLIDEAQPSKELQELHDKYAKKSELYLRANALIYSGAQTRRDDVLLSFQELPETEKNELKSALEGWIYESKTPANTACT